MPDVPTPYTLGANAVLPTTSFNTGVRDPLLLLLTPPLCELIQTVAQSVPNGGALITFDTEISDVLGMHSTASNTSRVFALYPGWYAISGGTAFVANATGAKGSWWMVNGVSVRGSEIILPSSAAGQTSTPARTQHVYLAAGDYLELFGYQSSGGALLTTTAAPQQECTMSVRWVSN